MIIYTEKKAILFSSYFISSWLISQRQMIFVTKEEFSRKIVFQKTQYVKIA